MEEKEEKEEDGGKEEKREETRAAVDIGSIWIRSIQVILASKSFTSIY